MLHRWFAQDPLRRVFKNAGLLLGSQGLAGLCGLAAFALAARALGTEQFGVLVLIHAYALVTATTVRFNGWYAVIRYGAACISDNRRRDLQGMVQFTGLLDLGGATIGAVGAVAAAPVIGPWLGWPPDAIALGQLYGVIIVFNAVDTPTGVLRLFDRFDTIAWLRLCSPLCRCLGAVGAYAVGANLGVFLIVWFVAEVANAILVWGFGMRELGRRGYLAGMTFRLRGLVRPHPGIWRLVWSTNLNSTLGMVLGRLTTLVLGSVLGPAAAGLYNVATQFAAVLERPVDMLRRSIYPELARLGAAGDFQGMRQLAVRSGLLVGACAVPLLLAVIGFAEPALRLTVGDAYVGAATVLGWLMARQAILAFGFPLGLTLVSLGRATALLKVNLVTSAIYVGLLTASLPLWGLEGAGFAASAAAVVATSLHAAVVIRTFRRETLPVNA